MAEDSAYDKRNRSGYDGPGRLRSTLRRAKRSLRNLRNSSPGPEQSQDDIAPPGGYAANAQSFNPALLPLDAHPTNGLFSAQPHQQCPYDAQMAPQYQQYGTQPMPCDPLEPQEARSAADNNNARKELTAYAAYTITKRSATSKGAARGTWAEVDVERIRSPGDIAKTIKRLDKEELISKKMGELGSDQRKAVTGVLDRKANERDAQFEWVVAQIGRALDKKGKKSTSSITVYLKRAPKADVDCEEVIKRREKRSLRDENAVHQMNTILQQQEIPTMGQFEQQQRNLPMRPVPTFIGLGRPVGGSSINQSRLGLHLSSFSASNIIDNTTSATEFGANVTTLAKKLDEFSIA